MRTALTREVSANLAQCELSHVERMPIDVEKARLQHGLYKEALAGMGCRIRSLPADGDYPDGVFVEDTAIVFDEVAVITRPGAVSRRPETSSVRDVLSRFRETVPIESPGTLDGGDVLSSGRTVLVGSSRRTNQSGIDQLRSILTGHGYDVRAVPIRQCLHLKSAVTSLRDGLLLVNREWLDSSCLRGFDILSVDPREPFGANALRIGDRLIYSDAYPETRARMESAGLSIVTVDLSELAKAEGAVTCCSIIIDEK